VKPNGTFNFFNSNITEQTPSLTTPVDRQSSVPSSAIELE
jgi:hypothetical protein